MTAGKDSALYEYRGDIPKPFEWCKALDES